ncbi:HIT family protein [Mycoplasmopsis anatis]|uniref:HIT family protein n=1 Tax=Mycoplasmopsis anatis TaxID=171279 RepID=A0A9Q3L9A4_9BACT|nr:HIT family protein [Mycoplasmopsis anatis]MBW0594659.1 HIT family protein [Mycoplasmopsis anatis]MBW0595079.1 HIT family protein [Mycoplasmopsis anatis]MBW0596005.1 HIT family protein [Mycoplasmopsis anatis]MBW0596576.1 HIT family protein [Mycoplasmopsis anatis]MBW0597478.1 HIT family protein [Mycoplasmopsis anatis]
MDVFKKIIDREIPATIVYEDDIVIAFLDAYPEKPGHFLVVPKSESKNIIENTDEEFIHAMKVVRKLINERLIKNGISDFKIQVNTGSKAGQTVFHTHIHVIPFK